MRTISYSEARQNLSTTMVQTVEDRAPHPHHSSKWDFLCSYVT